MLNDAEASTLIFGENYSEIIVSLKPKSEYLKLLAPLTNVCIEMREWCCKKDFEKNQISD